MSVHDEMFNMEYTQLDEVDEHHRIIQELRNETSTPPLISEEYKRGVMDALSQLRAMVIPHADIQRGIVWRKDAPQIMANDIEQKLLPDSAKESLDTNNECILPTQA